MKPNNNNPNPSSFHLPKIPTHLIGESALIDKETGQVYWQGGKRDTQSLLSPTNSLSTNDNITTYHLKSSLLTGLLVLSLGSILLSWIRNYLSTRQTNKLYYFFKICTILLYIIPLPKILHHPMIIATILLLYFIEAYNCNTRKYICNSMDCYDFEKYMNDIEDAKPEVSWKVRCFHYDDKFKKGVAVKTEDDLVEFGGNENGSRWNKKKVITHEISKEYNYTRYVL